MKKLLILLAVLTAFPVAGTAQLNVKRQTEKITKIATARTGFFNLMRQGDVFYISTTTTNKFDKSFILYLGEDIESAIATVGDLVELSGTMEKGTSIVIQNGRNECRISPGDLGALYFNQSGYAGFASCSKAELQKFEKSLKALRNAEKVKALQAKLDEEESAAEDGESKETAEDTEASE